MRIHEDGGPEVLRLDDVAVPEPHGSAALVEIRSSALNHLDIGLRRGLPSVPKPRTLGADGAGIVASLGPDATGVELGQPVLINPGMFCRRCRFCLAGEHSMCLRFKVLGEHVDGTNAEYVLVPSRNLHPIPAGWSFDEAAAFGLVFVTAWRMLITKARLQPGEWVLIWGIGGGVASSALEICRAAGARAIVTSSSDDKLARARASGAHATVNHARDDVADAVRSLTDGRGVDVVVEHVGAATWARSIDALARGGRLVTCGASSGGQPPAGIHRIFWKQVSVFGSTMGSDSEFRAVLELGASGLVRPQIDAVYPIERVAEAHARLEAGEQFGKVVLRVSG
ncbi:MAG TPA: zinc-binding dehydrogenase [Gaiellales bacterium]